MKNGGFAPPQGSSAISISHWCVIRATLAIRTIISLTRFLIVVVSPNEMDNPNKFSSTFERCRCPVGWLVHCTQDVDIIKTYDDWVCSKLVGRRLTPPLRPSFYACCRVYILKYIYVLSRKTNHSPQLKHLFASLEWFSVLASELQSIKDKSPHPTSQNSRLLSLRSLKKAETKNYAWVIEYQLIFTSCFKWLPHRSWFWQR